MTDVLDFNHGGATHPGARVIVHPGAGSDEHTVRYHVLTETAEHITVDDGYTYDKRTGIVRGPGGRPTLQNRVAATEGSAMYACWSQIAGIPPPHTAPDPGQVPALERAYTALRRLLTRE